MRFPNSRRFSRQKSLNGPNAVPFGWNRFVTPFLKMVNSGIELGRAEIEP
jgi:hypothetical protein